MTSHSLTPRTKVLMRLTVLIAAGCLLGIAVSSFNASAHSTEPSLWQRFLTAPVTTVQQVFGRKESLAATPASMPAAPPMAATITVNSTADGTLAVLAANATCDLREAITAANTNAAVGQCAAGMAGLDNIEFNLGMGTPSIALTDVLPAIAVNEPININGATGGATRVELNGTAVPAGLNGLAIFAGGSTIQSLVINNFAGTASKGIYIAVNGGNTIRNCYIGVNAAGTAAAAVSGDGVWIEDSPNNIIGGTTTADRNILSGNGTPGTGGSGVFISGTLSTGNKIINNYLGTDVTGTAALPNANNGLLIKFAPNNTVEKNLISGNIFDGAFIQGATATGNKVIGNLIGTNAAGTAALPNQNDGILLSFAPSNIIGGTTAAERNIISGNGNRGIWLYITGAAGNKIIGNYIGTDITGTLAIPNKSHGIMMQDAPDNFVGGTAAGEGNIIAFNQDQGVLVSPNTSMTAKGNKILGNSIFNNGNKGIALNANNLPIANDVLDADTGDDPMVITNYGGNHMQNYPVLSCAVSGGGSTTIKGTLNSLATTSFRVEFFSNDTCDTEGNGEGKTYLGFTNVTTDASGNATINATVAATVATSKVITSTATKLDGMGNPIETSEFSACQAVTAAPTLAIGNAIVVEGNAGQTMANFTVTLTGTAGCVTPVTVNYATIDNTATTGNSDYVNTTGTLTFDTPTKTISVPVNGDLTTELDETFFVNLSNPSGAGITTAQGTGTITNDDTNKTLSINDVTVTEGDSGTVNANFTVSLDVPATGPITVNFATANNTAIAGSDYVAASGTVSFAAGEQSKQVTVVVNGDTTVEANETFFVNLTNPSGATINKAQGVGTINNDDVATVAINDVTVTEGNSGTVNATFDVTLTKPSATTVTVQYQTADSLATAGSDYAALALSTLTFNPGEITKQITVVVNGDTTVERDETFLVSLSNPNGATMGKAVGTGTITNDDSATVAINDVTVTEGNGGTVNATFNVTLSNASAEQVTISYATTNGTATTADSDYVSTNGTVTFAAGEKSKTVTVTVNGDTKVEANETFNVNLSNIIGNSPVPDPTMGDALGIGTINNDDTATIAINDVMVTEGNSGTVNATFSVSLSALVDQSVVVNFATMNGTATTANNDYVAASGTVTFAANSNAAQTITILVNGDTAAENDETFLVNLTPNSLPTGVTIADNQGIGTIKDDDSTIAPTLTASMNDPFVCNGIGGAVEVTAKLTNTNATSLPASFSVTLPSMLTILPGTCTATTGACTTTPPNQVAWGGTLLAGETVTITYQAQIADGTPDGTVITINSEGKLKDVKTTATATGTVSCPGANLNSSPANVALSDQKAGSVLVFPYYTSKIATKADTRLSLSNVGTKQAYLHIFLLDGATCQQADYSVCLTPNGSFTFTASETDPETTGWVLVVATDAQGKPVQNNALIGNAFLKDGNYLGNYSAESFWANSANVATINNNTATLRFDDTGYDAVPNQVAIEIQSPRDVVGQKVVTVGLNGDLNEAQLKGAGQVGAGVAYNANENPFGSFVGFLTGTCQAISTITTTNPRVPLTMGGLVPSGQAGTLKLNIGSGVGLLLTPQNATKWSGIRGLHKTSTTFSTITIPLTPPIC